MKHSSGPWRWSDENDTARTPVLYDARGTAIFVTEMGFMPSDKDMAIVAAAPELLDALRGLLRLHDLGGDDSFHAAHALIERLDEDK